MFSLKEIKKITTILYTENYDIIKNKISKKKEINTSEFFFRLKNKNIKNKKLKNKINKIFEYKNFENEFFYQEIDNLFKKIIKDNF